jgi:hypothetical protein
MTGKQVPQDAVSLGPKNWIVTLMMHGRPLPSRPSIDVSPDNWKGKKRGCPGRAICGLRNTIAQ